MPDWIKEAEAAVSADEIPAWLLETIQQTSTPEPEFMEMIIDEPAPPPAPVSPAPPAPQAAVVSEGFSLAEARRLAQANELSASLAHYEGLIRAQINLDDVVDDLSSLARQYRDNPLVFRLLGDGLMRQGKLQQALDTYRQALNQL
jgi:tetratricopeptide (TPR) repeat protein